MVIKDTKISQKIINKSLLSIENNIVERVKTLYFDYKKLFSFRRLCFFPRVNKRIFFISRLGLKRTLDIRN